MVCSVNSSSITEGKELQTKLDAAGKLEGAALDTAVNDLRKDIESREALSASVTIQLRKDTEALAKKVVDFKKAAAKALSANLQVVAVAKAETEGKGSGLLLIHLNPLEADAKLLKPILEVVQKTVGDGTAVVGFSRGGGKIVCMASVPKPLQKSLKAGDVIKNCMPLLGGKGGGKPDFAQGQGTNEAGLADALAKIKELGKALGTATELTCELEAAAAPDAAAAVQFSQSSARAYHRLSPCHSARYCLCLFLCCCSLARE